MNNWVCEARDCRWHSKAVICLDVSDCFYFLMGTLPIKAQFTASHGSCKDIAFFLMCFFFFFLNSRGYFWMKAGTEALRFWVCVKEFLSCNLCWLFLNLTSESLIDPFSIYFYATNRTNCISRRAIHIYTVTFHIMYQNIISIAYLTVLSREGKRGQLF